jgi:hypothetical protein
MTDSSLSSVDSPLVEAFEGAPPEAYAGKVEGFSISSASTRRLGKSVLATFGMMMLGFFRPNSTLAGVLSTAFDAGGRFGT